MADVVKARQQLRRDTAAQWTATNPVLAAGELGLETDTSRFKVGDGSTAWSALPYAAVQPGDLGTAAQANTADLVQTSGNQTITGTKTFNGVINGTAVTTSATDTTAGRLLKVGDFGVGNTGTVSDILDLDDATKATGFYRIANGTLGTKPAGISTSSVVLVQNLVSGVVSQTLWSVTTDAVFSRYRSGGIWSPWRELYHTGNLLGTVSQSGGVPTGAVIERGTGNGGDYVRFADGTQICTRAIGNVALPIDVAYQGGFISALQEQLFAAAFVSAPIVSYTPEGSFGVTGDTPTTTLARWYYARVNSTASTTVRMRLVAIGRWF